MQSATQTNQKYLINRADLSAVFSGKLIIRVNGAFFAPASQIANHFDLSPALVRGALAEFELRDAVAEVDGEWYGDFTAAFAVATEVAV